MTTAFLSYSIDDEQHAAWVRTLTAKLKGDGISITVDQGKRIPPAELAAFMKSAVLAHEYVLVICTPKYRARSEQGAAGGYVGDIFSADALTTGNQRKFIPILRKGDWGEAGPLWLSEYYIDLRESPRFEERYQDLLATLRGIKGRMTYQAKPSEPVVVADEPEEDPVRIIGVITEDVGVPRMSGNSPTAWYRVPLRLSKVVPPDWEKLFERNWNHSPRFAELRRASIAQVNQDRIVMSCTTLEEVLGDHRMMLVECVNATNRMLREKNLETRKAEAEFKRRQEDHKRHVQELVEQVKFEE